MERASQTRRNPRRAFIAQTARLAVGATALAALGRGVESPLGPAVASAHNISGNALRASELYTAMQTNFYLGASQGYLYNETSPRARSNPYAYLWPFYEALAGTIDLSGVGTTQQVVQPVDVDNRLTGLGAYWNGDAGGYDSYPRSPYGAGGDRYNDDIAWIGRAMVQLHRMGYTSTASPSPLGTTPLERAKALFTFIKASWDTTSSPSAGGVYWVQQPAGAAGGKDRGTGPTGGFAKLALHLSDPKLTGQQDPYFTWGKTAYKWVHDNLLTKQGQAAYVGKLYWDKILGSNGSLDTRYWSYNQGVMIGAGVLLARLAPTYEPGDPELRTYLNFSGKSVLELAVDTADAAIAYYNSVGWYSQPVIFNSLFFRNLLLLCGALSPGDSKISSYRGAAQTFADNVWNDSKIHNMQKHMIKFDPRTSVYKLREQAGMVQLFACLAWIDAGKDLSILA